MIRLSDVYEEIIKPSHLSMDEEEKQQQFLSRFNECQLSLTFMQLLADYSCAKNACRWPARITPKIMSELSHEARYQIIPEDMYIFEEGYLQKIDNDEYELTHELIVLTFIMCSDGTQLPLHSHHIDFVQTIQHQRLTLFDAPPTGPVMSFEERVTSAFRHIYDMHEPDAIAFIAALIRTLATTHGRLYDRAFHMKVLYEIATEKNLVYDICIDWVEKLRLIFIDKEERVFCSGLFLLAYMASPRMLEI